MKNCCSRCFGCSCCCCASRRPKRLKTSRAPCRTCKRTWPAPRSLGYRLVGHMPEHIHMSTAEAHVAFQNSDPVTQEPRICEEVFENMEFTTHQRRFGHRLVTEFEYDKETGDIFYDIAEQESPQNGYARLITLNSWYLSLLQAIVCVTFSAIDIQGNIMLLGSLFYEAERAQLFTYSRWVFAALWGIMIVVASSIAVIDARKEWSIKASPVVGDIIDRGGVDSWGAFLALVAFRFFDVEKQVKDIVILLHPWKAVQPFAALDCEGSRCYLVGYPSEHLFRTENRAGRHLTLVVMLILKLTVLAAKIYFIIYLPPSQQLMVLLAVISSVPSVVWALWAWWCHKADRARAKRWLVKRLKEKGLNQCETVAIRQILKQHWGVDVDQATRVRRQQSNLDDIPRKWSPGALANLEERCGGCGRKLQGKRDEAFSCCQNAPEFQAESEAPEFHGESNRLAHVPAKPLDSIAPTLPGAASTELPDTCAASAEPFDANADISASTKSWSQVRMVMAGFCEWEPAVEPNFARILPIEGSFVAGGMDPPAVGQRQQKAAADAGMNVPRVAWQATSRSPRKAKQVALLLSRDDARNNTAAAGLRAQRQQYADAAANGSQQPS